MNGGNASLANDWVSSRRGLDALNDWKNRCPVVQEGRFYVRETGSGGEPVLKAVGGLLTPLGQCFWNDGRIEEEEEDEDREKIPSAPRPVKGSYAPRKKSRDDRRHAGSCGGVARGSLVHREIKQFVELDRSSFLKVNKGAMHPWTGVVLKELVSRGWMPAHSEYLVYDARIRVATAIDLVCANASGKLLFVELKTGHANNFVRSSGRMRGVLSRFEDCPRSRACLQLAVSVLMALRETSLKPEDFECLVVRVDDSGVELHSVSHDFLYDNAVSAYVEMATRRLVRSEPKPKAKKIASRTVSI